MKILLKQLTTALLIFAVFASNFSSGFVYAGFKVNQDYIAKNLCVNRFNPSLHCNGKCYFMRKIKEANDREKSQEQQLQKNLIQAGIFDQAAKIHFYSLVLQVIIASVHSLSLPLINIPIFQPPPIS
jgi:hypothetical protein